MEPEPEPEIEYRCLKCNAPADWDPTVGGEWMCKCGSRILAPRVKARPILPPEEPWHP